MIAGNGIPDVVNEHKISLPIVKQKASPDYSGSGLAISVTK